MNKLTQNEPLKRFLKFHGMKIHDTGHGVLRITHRRYDHKVDDDITVVITKLLLLNPRLRCVNISMLPGNEIEWAIMAIFEEKQSKGEAPLAFS